MNNDAYAQLPMDKIVEFRPFTKHVHIEENAHGTECNFLTLWPPARRLCPFCMIRIWMSQAQALRIARSSYVEKSIPIAPSPPSVRAGPSKPIVKNESN
eukprot:COSAG03_NODE_21_length_21000_cov_26.440649_17_plen_99_part_00